MNQKKEVEESAVYEYDITLLVVAGLLIAFFYIASSILQGSTEMRRKNMYRKGN